MGTLSRPVLHFQLYISSTPSSTSTREEKYKTTIMDSSKLVSPLSAIYYVISTLFCLTAVSPSSVFDLIRYDNHCGSIVPNATDSDTESTVDPFLGNQQGYFLGGDEHPSNSSNYYYGSLRRQFYLRTEHVYSTSDDDLYKVVADLILKSHGIRMSHVAGTTYTETLLGPSEFKLQGFWLRSTGYLCMVGSASVTSSKETKGYAVLKLSGVKSSCDITSLITGTLERLSNISTPSKPVPLLIFPLRKCEAPEVLQSGLPAGIDVSKELSLSLPLSKPICSVFDYYFNLFKLEYGNNCKSTNSCNLFGESLAYLPQAMSLRIIQCSEDKQRPSFLVGFPNSTYVSYYQTFDTSSSLVAHGAWDAKKRQLFAVACRIFGSASSTDGSRLDDCSIRLSLRLPATWSVGNTSAIVGYLWSNKKKPESGYFDRIKFRSSGMKALGIEGLKYKYTLLERAASTCQKKNLQAKTGKQYPQGKDYGMQFSMSIKSIKGNRSLYGYANPVFVGDKPWTRNSMGFEASSRVEAKVSRSPVQISYDMTFNSFDASSRSRTLALRISAEGTYNPETGFLCMIGCRYPPRTSTTEAVDCEILVDVQFPPINSNKRIEGKIESTRGNTDSRHFETISFSAAPYYSNRDTIWRMDFEIIMALVSNTLVCIFVAYQILYVKKHPGVFQLISLVMLVVLTLGQMIPLLLNFEAMFSSSRNRGGFYGGGSSGWVEINEVFVRVITMVAFLLQVRLLQLVFSARMADGNQKASWITEKKVFYVCFLLYITGGLIAFLLNRKKYGFGEVMRSKRRRFHRNRRSIWNDSTSYAGLILDCFLLPQVLFNIFQSSSDHALSRIFYMGTTLVRLVPHAYDLYRGRHYLDSGSYMYAAPGADYYSTAWDVTILLLGLLFASLVFLQQRFGGRCFLPKRFKQAAEYEKLPLETSVA